MLQSVKAGDGGCYYAKGPWDWLWCNSRVWFCPRTLRCSGSLDALPSMGARRSCPFPGEQESGKAWTLSPVLQRGWGPRGGSNFLLHRLYSELLLGGSRCHRVGEQQMPVEPGVQSHVAKWRKSDLWPQRVPFRHYSLRLKWTLLWENLRFTKTSEILHRVPSGPSPVSAINTWQDQGAFITAGGPASLTVLSCPYSYLDLSSLALKPPLLSQGPTQDCIMFHRPVSLGSPELHVFLRLYLA